MLLPRLVPAVGLTLLLAAPALAKTKISTIGASTTMGSGAPAGQSYPDQLQKLLGPEYEVRNFGKSGAGALRAGNPTYWNSAEQRGAAAFAPDIVVNWLGGADSKAASWDAHKGEFLGDYKAMIKYYQDLPSRPKIISLMSVARYNDAGVRKTILEAEVNPLQRQGAQETGSRFIDTKSLLNDRAEYFTDGVHLTQAGYAVVAKAVEAEVRALAAEADAGAPGTDAAVADAGAAPADGKAEVSVPAADGPGGAVADMGMVTPNPTPTTPPAVDAATPPTGGTKRDAATSTPAGSGASGSSGRSGCAMGGRAGDAPAWLWLTLTALTLALSLRSGRGQTRSGDPGRDTAEWRSD